MPKRALAEHRPYLLLSLLFGVSYFFVQDDRFGGAWLMLWKGAGVFFLALYALHRGRGRDGVLITLIMSLSSLADVLLEISFLFGGLVFALAHAVSIGLYLANRRDITSSSQKLAAITLLILTPAVVGLMTYPLENWEIATTYSLIVGAMAATAWTSRFPRFRVGIGAVLFVVSDLLIFGRETGHVSLDLAGWLIWPLYFAGQFLIVTGVVQTSRHAVAMRAQARRPFEDF